MIAENETFKTPEENYETAALELAIYRMMQRDHDNAKAAFSPKDAKKLSQTAQKSLPHMLKLIDRQTRKLALHKTLRKQGFRILKTAAVIVLVLNMGLTIATAASSNIRAKVIEFLAEINDSYMVISFMTTDEELSVPETWTENYYPTYIPEEYSLQFINSQNGISEVEYADAQANKLRIQICDITVINRINTENADISHTTIQEMKATVLQQPYGETDVIWAMGDRYFIVTGCDYETVQAVTESIKIIKKQKTNVNAATKRLLLHLQGEYGRRRSLYVKENVVIDAGNGLSHAFFVKRLLLLHNGMRIAWNRSIHTLLLSLGVLI